MTPPLTIQTPPSHPLHTYLPAEQQAPQALTRTSRSGEISDLQRKLGAVMKRVVGEDAIPPASSSPLPPASPAWENTTPNYAPTVDADRNTIEHHNGGSEYDAVDREGARQRRRSTPAPPHPTRNAEARTPISSPGSYEALAALNPYLVDVDDLARRLSGVEMPAPAAATAGEDERGRKPARPQQLQQKEVERELESDFDSAYAAVVAEEKAALEALRRQIRDESVKEEGAEES